MRIIHKHQIDAQHPGRTTIRTSFAARVLHVEAQTSDEFVLSIWFDLDDGSPRIDREFQFFATGSYPPERAEFVSTHVLVDGQFVLHLFEVTSS